MYLSPVRTVAIAIAVSLVVAFNLHTLREQPSRVFQDFLCGNFQSIFIISPVNINKRLTRYNALKNVNTSLTS